MTRLATGMLVRIVDSDDVGTLIQIRESTQTCVIKLTSGALRKNVPLDDVKEARGGANDGGASVKSPIRLGGASEPLALPPSMASPGKRSGKLEAGDAVRARYKKGAKWFDGKILKVRADGTYDVQYDDGDVEMKVEAQYVEAAEKPPKLQLSPVKSPTAKSSASQFSVGDKVKARYKKGAKLFSGKVTKAHADGSYDIRYDDGDVETHVEASYIQSEREDESPREVSSPKKSSAMKSRVEYEVGDKVKARYKKGAKLFAGKVVKAHADGSYDIRYDDGDVETRVDPQYMEGAASEEPPASSPKKSVSKTQQRRIGDKVRARYKKGAKFFNGTVTKVHADGSVDIRYEDGDTESRVEPKYIEAVENDASDVDDEPKKMKSSSKGWRVDDEVMAKYKKGKKLYAGTIKRVRTDGTYDIRYEDGDVETRVDTQYIEPPPERATSPRASSPKKASTSSSSSSFEMGDKVKARYKGGARLLPGKIVKARVDGTFDVKFEDGDVETGVEPRHIESAEGRETDKEDSLEVGDRVTARYKKGAKYFPCKVVKTHSDGTYDIKYDDGDTETRVAAAMIQRQEKPTTKTTKSEATELQVGEPIKARYKKGAKYFTGKIKRVRADGTYDVEYDDGDVELSVRADYIEAEEKSKSPKKKATPLEVGDAVKARYKKGAKLFRGVVKRVRTDGTYDIKYEDGDVETSVEIEYIERDGGSKDEDVKKNSASGFDVGDKVKARYKNSQKWYDGRISRVRGDGTYDIEYDDGEQELRVDASKIEAIGTKAKAVSPTEKAIELRVGDAVKARYKGGKKLYAAEVTRVRTDGTFDLKYEDGDTETRVERDMIETVAAASNEDDRKRGKNTELGVGDSVMAQYKGGKKMYKGTITRVRATGSYDIEYEDGDRELRVAPDKVQPVEDERKKPGKDSGKDVVDELSVGDVVQAYYKRGKKLYDGKILRCHSDDTFDVQYDDGDVEKRVEWQLIVVPERKKEKVKTKKLKIGDAVNAKHRKSGTKRVRGQISRERSDGTFDIEFDDGETATRVELELIEVLSDVESQSDNGKRKPREAFEVGDAVKARYKKGAKLFPGKITRVRADGTYDVKYEDGDVETSVDAEYIESVGTKTKGKEEEDSGFEVGDAVSARYKGGLKWYDGTVKRVRADGTIDIRYEDGDVEERVKGENVRRNANKHDERESPKRIANAKWKKGDEVEADYKEKGRYRHAVVARVHDDGSVDVEYDNGDVEKRVAGKHVRGLGGDDKEKDKSSSSRKEKHQSSDSESDNRKKKPRKKASVASSDSEEDRKSKKGKKPKITKGARVTKRKAVDAKSRRIGRVKKLHGDGSCDVEYASGETAKRIASDALLLCSDEDESEEEKPKAAKRRGLFSRDQVVMSCWRRPTRMAKPAISDRWNDAVILARNDDGSYSIRYRNGEMEEDVPEEAIKARDESPKALSKAGASRPQEPRELSEVDVVFLLEQLAMTLHEEGQLKTKPRLRFSGVTQDSDSGSSSESGGNSNSSSDEGKRSEDSTTKRTKSSKRKRPRGAVEKALQGLFDAKLLKKYQTMFDQHDTQESGRIYKSKIFHIVENLCSPEAPEAAKDNTVRRLLTEWFSAQDSLRTHSKFDFPTLMMAFAVAKHHLSKTKIHQNMANALEARFASHHESKKQLELWQQKLGFRMFETLQRFFHDSALPRMYPAQVRVSEIASIFDQVTRSAVPNKPLEVYLKQMQLMHHHTLHLPEFMCCYYQLYGSQDASRAPVWAEQLELRPIAFVASCLFSNGDACCERHGDLVRRLSIGRTPTQVDMVMRFREVFESLQSVDGSDASDTTISTSQLEAFASKVVGDPSVLEQSVLALRKRTAAVSLVELFATCGFVIDELTSAPTVVNAIEKMRLRTEAAEVRRIIGLVRNMCLKVLRFPNNPDYWRVRSDSTAFHQKLGRFDGATSLLESVGFVEYGKTHFELRGARAPDGKRVSCLPKATLDTLRDKCAELDSELSVMDGVESVVSILQRIAKEREHDTPLSLEECEDILRNLATYIENVLKNPKDSRCWRIRESNKTFQRQVGYLPFHADLLASIGYEFTSSSQGNVYTLRGTGLGGKTNDQSVDKTDVSASLANFAFSSLSAQMEWFLWRRKQEIESLLQDDMEYLVQMLGPSTSSAAHNKSRGGFSTSMTRLKDSGTTSKMYPYGRNAVEIFSKTTAQKTQLEMMKTQFESLDTTKRGFLKAEDLNRTPSQPKWASFECFDLDRDDRVDFADFVGALGPALDHPFDPLDMGEFVPFKRLSLSEQVSTLVGRLRMTATIPETTAILDAVISSLSRIVGQPDVSDLRQISSKSPLATFCVRFPAVKELLQLAGYRPPSSQVAPASPSHSKDSKMEAAFILQPPQNVRFQTTAKPPTDSAHAAPLDPQTLSRLQLMAAMLGGHARLLLFSAISDVASVARAIGEMRPIADWIKLVELVVMCLENILKHPEDESRYRQLNTSTQTFTSVVAKVVGGVQLFPAMGFRETDRGTLVLPDEVKRSEVVARKLELTVGCQVLRIADKLSQQGTDDAEFPSAASPRRAEGGENSAVDYYKRKAIAAELAREVALRKSAHLEKQLEIVAKTHPRRSIGTALTTPTPRTRPASASVSANQVAKKKAATRPGSPSLRAAQAFMGRIDVGYSIEDEILAEFSPRKRDSDQNIATMLHSTNKQKPGRGGRGGGRGGPSQSLRGSSFKQPPKATQRRVPNPAPSSTTLGTLQEATLAIDSDTGSSFIVLRSSHSSLQKGALLRVGTESRDLTEERLIGDVDHATYPNLTKVTLHIPLQFPHYTRDLVFVLPPKAVSRVDDVTHAAEISEYLQHEVLDRIVQRAVEIASTSLGISPVKSSTLKTSRGDFTSKNVRSLALVGQIDLPRDTFVSVTGVGSQNLIITTKTATQSSASVTVVHDVVTLKKLRAIWEGLVMQFGGSKGDSVSFRCVLDVVRKIPWLAMHQPRASEVKDTRKSVTWEAFVEWLCFPVDDDRPVSGDEDEDSPEQLLAISLLRQHFHALISDRVDDNGVFALVPADELVKRASTSLLTLTHSPTEARDLTTVLSLLTRLTTSVSSPSNNAWISWPEIVYRVRRAQSLQLPELLPVTTTMSFQTHDGQKPRLVVAVVSARRRDLVFVLFADGYMETWRSDAKGSSELVARTFVMLSASSSIRSSSSLVEDIFSFIAQAKRDREWLERQRQRAQSALDGFVRSTSPSRTLLALTAQESCVVVNATMLMDRDHPSVSGGLITFTIDATSSTVLLRPLLRLLMKKSSLTIKMQGVKSDKGSERVVSSGGVIEEFALSPSGTRIAFKVAGKSSVGLLWVSDASTGEVVTCVDEFAWIQDSTVLFKWSDDSFSPTLCVAASKSSFASIYRFQRGDQRQRVACALSTGLPTRTTPTPFVTAVEATQSLVVLAFADGSVGVWSIDTTMQQERILPSIVQQTRSSVRDIVSLASSYAADYREDDADRLSAIKVDADEKDRLNGWEDKLSEHCVRLALYLLADGDVVSVAVPGRYSLGLVTLDAMAHVHEDESLTTSRDFERVLLQPEAVVRVLLVTCEYLHDGVFAQKTMQEMLDDIRSKRLLQMTQSQMQTFIQAYQDSVLLQMRCYYRAGDSAEFSLSMPLTKSTPADSLSLVFGLVTDLRAKKKGPKSVLQLWSFASPPTTAMVSTIDEASLCQRAAWELEAFRIRRQRVLLGMLQRQERVAEQRRGIMDGVKRSLVGLFEQERSREVEERVAEAVLSGIQQLCRLEAFAVRDNDPVERFVRGLFTDSIPTGPSAALVEIFRDAEREAVVFRPWLQRLRVALASESFDASDVDMAIQLIRRWRSELLSFASLCDVVREVGALDHSSSSFPDQRLDSGTIQQQFCAFVLSKRTVVSQKLSGVNADSEYNQLLTFIHPRLAVEFLMRSCDVGDRVEKCIDVLVDRTSGNKSSNVSAKEGTQSAQRIYAQLIVRQRLMQRLSAIEQRYLACQQSSEPSFASHVSAATLQCLRRELKTSLPSAAPLISAVTLALPIEQRRFQNRVVMKGDGVLINADGGQQHQSTGRVSVSIFVFPGRDVRLFQRECALYRRLQQWKTRDLFLPVVPSVSDLPILRSEYLPCDETAQTLVAESLDGWRTLSQCVLALRRAGVTHSLGYWQHLLLFWCRQVLLGLVVLEEDKLSLASLHPDSLIVSSDGKQVRFAALDISNEASGTTTDNVAAFGAFVVLLCELFTGDSKTSTQVRPSNDFVKLKTMQQLLWTVWCVETDDDQPLPVASAVDFTQRHGASTNSSLSRVVGAALLALQPRAVRSRPASASELWAFAFSDVDEEAPEPQAIELALVTDFQSQLEELVAHPIRHPTCGDLNVLTATTLLQSTAHYIDTLVLRLLRLSETSDWQFSLRSVFLRNISQELVLHQTASTAVLLFEKCMRVDQRDAAHSVIQAALDLLHSILSHIEAYLPLASLLSDGGLQSLVRDAIHSMVVICNASPLSSNGIPVRVSPAIEAALWRLSEPSLRDLIPMDTASIKYPVVHRFLHATKTSLADVFAIEVDKKAAAQPLLMAWWRPSVATHTGTASPPLHHLCSVINSTGDSPDTSMAFLSLVFQTLELRFNTSNAASAAAVKFRLAALQSCLSPELLDRKTMAPLVLARDLPARVWLHLDMVTMLCDALRDSDDRIVYGTFSIIEAYTRVLRFSSPHTKPGEVTERHYFHWTSPAYQLAVALAGHHAIQGEVSGILSRVVRALKVMGEAGVNAAISTRYGSNATRAANPVALLSVALAFLVNCLHGGDACTHHWVSSGLSTVVLAHAKASTLPFVRVCDSNWMSNGSTLSTRSSSATGQWSVFTTPSNGVQKTSPFELLLRDFVRETAVRNTVLVNHWRLSSSYFRQLLDDREATASSSIHLLASNDFGKLSHVWDCERDIEECDGTLEEQRSALEYAVSTIRLWLSTCSSSPATPLTLEKICGVAWSWLDGSWQALLHADATDENISKHAAIVATVLQLVDMIAHNESISAADLHRLVRPAAREHDDHDASDSVFAILWSCLWSMIKSSSSSQLSEKSRSVFCSSLELVLGLIDSSKATNVAEVHRAGVLLQQFVTLKPLLRLLRTDSLRLAQCCSRQKETGFQYAIQCKRRLWASLLHRGDREVARVILDEGIVEFWLDQLLDQDVLLEQEEDDADANDDAVAAVNGRLEAVGFLEMLLHAQSMLGRRHSLMVQLLTTELIKCVLHFRTIPTEKQRVLTYTQFCRTHQSRQSSLPSLAARMVATAKRSVQLICCLVVDSTTHQIDDAVMATLSAAGIPDRIVRWHQQTQPSAEEVSADKSISEFWDLWPGESASQHSLERRRASMREVRVAVPQSKLLSRQQRQAASPITLKSSKTDPSSVSTANRVQLDESKLKAAVDSQDMFKTQRERLKSALKEAIPQRSEGIAPSFAVADRKPSSLGSKEGAPASKASVSELVVQMTLSPKKRVEQPAHKTNELRESVVQTLMSIDMESARALQQQQLRADRRRRSRAKHAEESKPQPADHHESGDSLGSDAYSPFSDSGSDASASTRKKLKNRQDDAKTKRMKMRKQAKEEKPRSDAASERSAGSSDSGSRSVSRHGRRRRDSSSSSSSRSASSAPRRKSKPKSKPRVKKKTEKSDHVPVVVIKQQPTQSTNPNEAALRQIFAKYDVDGDGAIGFVDLRRVLGPNKLSNVELQRWIAEKDRRGVGAVDFDDFVFAFAKTPATHNQSSAQQQKPQLQQTPLSPLLVGRRDDRRVVIGTQLTSHKSHGGRGHRLGGGGGSRNGAGGGEWESRRKC